MLRPLLAAVLAPLLAPAACAKLLEEAKADADQEGFCDTEIGKSKVTRNKLAEDISSLEAAVDQGKSTVLELTERLANLNQEVSDLTKSMNEASEMRADEKAKNAATVADAKAGEKATAAATDRKSVV